MNKQGIGWFKLDLITYPENAYFIGTSIDENSIESVVKNNKSKLESSIQKDWVEMADVNKETNKTVTLRIKEQESRKIEKIVSTFVCINRKSEVTAK